MKLCLNPECIRPAGHPGLCRSSGWRRWRRRFRALLFGLPGLLALACGGQVADPPRGLPEAFCEARELCLPRSKPVTALPWTVAASVEIGVDLEDTYDQCLVRAQIVDDYLGPGLAALAVQALEEDPCNPQFPGRELEE